MFAVNIIQKYCPIKNLSVNSKKLEQKIDSIGQSVFIKNYYTQHIKSECLCWGSLSAVSWALFQYVLRQNIDSAFTWLKIATFLGVIWFIRGNDPNRLAKKAFQAIEAQGPDKAIGFIQEGANLDLLFSESKGSGQLVPFLPIYWYPGLSVSLLEKAVLHNSLKVSSHLISIGFNLEHTRALNMADNLNMVQFLIENGMPPDVDTKAFYCLEPYNWPSLAWWAQKLAGAICDDKFDEMKKNFKIINFLRKKGAKIVREDIDFDNALINQIDQIPLGEEDQALNNQNLLVWMFKWAGD